MTEGVFLSNEELADIREVVKKLWGDFIVLTHTETTKPVLTLTDMEQQLIKLDYIFGRSEGSAT